MGGGSIDGDADNRVLPPLPPTCNGVTNQQKPCAISWGLDALGFCKFHSPQASQCRGIARSTGLRCRLRWDLNAHGYCRHHAAASSSTTRQCVAIARSTGQRCRIAVGIDANGLCSVHRQTKGPTSNCPPPSRCHGVVMYSGEPCGNVAKPGYAYCCAAHDPSLPYFSPRLFDAGDKPRALLEPLVVEVYEGRDLYHGDALDLATPGLLELDHILEKQCFSYAFHGLKFADREKDVAFLASVVREDFANQLNNLCLTRAATNKIKGAAVWKFLDDLLTGHADSMPAKPATFTSYMMAETRDGTRLGRNTTRVIVREMGRALKECQYKMAEQGETPLLDALSQQLQQVFVKMDLHVAASVQAKWDAETAHRDSRACSEQGNRGADAHISLVDDYLITSGLPPPPAVEPTLPIGGYGYSSTLEQTLQLTPDKGNESEKVPETKPSASTELRILREDPTTSRKSDKDSAGSSSYGVDGGDAV